MAARNVRKPVSGKSNPPDEPGDDYMFTSKRSENTLKD